jgi:hypothetical protein
MERAGHPCSPHHRQREAPDFRADRGGTTVAEAAVMRDLVFIASTVVFFAVSWAYARACERL